ncbi:MAG: type II toxin-antitoxin system VapC family toxin [Candidatus Binataceae bacterium]|nr:type II toxin-antitoxin system VapC family toxin [Candidatus Binataceae bacterium]
MSLYIRDANSSGAIETMAKLGPSLLTTSFGEFEFLNAIHLRLFRKEADPGQVRAVEAAFQSHLTGRVISVQPIPPEIYSTAIQIVRRFTPRLGIRSLDLLHVASALAIKVDTFLTFDRSQKRLAEVAGLKTL